jgi:hypothetical protein
MKDYSTGVTRVKEKFLFLPLTLNDQTKWLKKVSIRQELIMRYDTTIPERFGEVAPAPKRIWINKSFESRHPEK